MTMTKTEARKKLLVNEIKCLDLKNKHAITNELGRYYLKRWYSIGEGMNTKTEFSSPIISSYDFTTCWNKAKEMEII